MFLKIRQLLDWVYKSKCYLCKKTINEGSFCEDCIDEIDLDSSFIRYLDGVKVYTAGFYTGNLRKIIRAIKYHQKKEFASILAKILYEKLKELEDDKVSFEIIPVPSHKKRMNQRKYNHMDLVAEEFAKLSGYPVNKSLIKRIKDTKPQYKLNSLQRAQNVKGAFVVDKTKYKGTTVLIIDDICTSGATIMEMANELKKSGITDVRAIVVTSSTFN